VVSTNKKIRNLGKKTLSFISQKRLAKRTFKKRNKKLPVLRVIPVFNAEEYYNKKKCSSEGSF